MNLPRFGRLFIELLLVILVVGGLQAWRARDLLPADERTVAPPFELEDLDGRAWSLEQLRGKPAVIYFFAPWCGVCAASSPQLRWFQRWRGGEVSVLLIGLDYASPGELQEYARDHGLDVPVLAGRPDTGVAYRVRGYPTYYVLDAQGRIAARDMGYTTAPGLWFRTLGL